jgi:hypothetical protein
VAEKPPLGGCAQRIERAGPLAVSTRDGGLGLSGEAGRHPCSGIRPSPDGHGPLALEHGVIREQGVEQQMLTGCGAGGHQAHDRRDEAEESVHFKPNSDIGDKETIEIVGSGVIRRRSRSQDFSCSSSFDPFAALVVPTSSSVSKGTSGIKENGGSASGAAA